jgi:hypothetical protein
MKTPFVLSALLLTIATPAFAMPGKVIVNCDNGHVTARIKITPKGNVLNAASDEDVLAYEIVTEDSTDPRGYIYRGKSAELLIPNTQRPSRDGSYLAILETADNSTYQLTCTR